MKSLLGTSMESWVFLSPECPPPTLLCPPPASTLPFSSYNKHRSQKILATTYIQINLTFLQSLSESRKTLNVNWSSGNRRILNDPRTLLQPHRKSLRDSLENRSDHQKDHGKGHKEDIDPWDSSYSPPASNDVILRVFNSSIGRLLCLCDWLFSIVQIWWLNCTRSLGMADWLVINQSIAFLIIKMAKLRYGLVHGSLIYHGR
jgi:hypothetical protein